MKSGSEVILILSKQILPCTDFVHYILIFINVSHTSATREALCSVTYNYSHSVSDL